MVESVLPLTDEEIQEMANDLRDRNAVVSTESHGMDGMSVVDIEIQFEGMNTQEVMMFLENNYGGVNSLLYKKSEEIIKKAFEDNPVTFETKSIKQIGLLVMNVRKNLSSSWQKTMGVLDKVA